MKRRITTIVIFTIIIGIFALAINTAFGNQTVMFVQRIKYQVGQTHFYYYKFNWWDYLKNLELSTSDMSILVFETPTKQWVTITGTMLDAQWWQALGDDLAVILNYIIMGLNILIYPLRVGGYLIKNILALLGINQDTTNPRNGLAWLINFVNTIFSNLAIPYIQ